MNITDVPIEDVTPYEGNPRSISPTAIDKVAKSIEDFGFRQPIVVDTNNVIIVGHTRYLAAKKLGMKTVPIHVAEDLDETKTRLYRIADNKTGELAEWDDALLRTELQSLMDELEGNLESTAFTQNELLKALQPPDANVTGSTELNAGDFQNFQHKCPRCGFEYDKDAKAEPE